ncbi:2-phospho-L-lactate guanylyltransferase [Subtercola boreus]|uniref:Phosphoenolpyruvate guanylyltransferase n=1 Tax=Subtercola boreus TaxID=120213 RepID=A0A3E0WCG1_9MICO|nr:2-phospho-L-lactate guanylyltransferase [Subtercola boreus]RFA22396.1 2-phospho-L-lactate guanylyltransferase [Subtercola boreus]RFA22458.1 2-phospho-L-lactate guanylyltransferase [Subtercola boreus]RFA28473.1 2-phospho-L-lactate guanylyltransferase [Subtercola boreus]
MRAVGWVVVVPVKGTDLSKTRLADLPASVEFRRRLALAFALDTITAITAAAGVVEVLVVTGDPESAAALARLGTDTLPVTTVPDPGDGLNTAILRGVALARTRRPAAAIAAITADLPSLTTVDVDDALRLAMGHPTAFIADADATGTTTVTVQPGFALTPRFGPGSAAAHAASGMIALPIPLESSIRHDVDTPTDLEATSATFGPHTRRTLDSGRGAGETA